MSATRGYPSGGRLVTRQAVILAGLYLFDFEAAHRSFDPRLLLLLRAAASSERRSAWIIQTKDLRALSRSNCRSRLRPRIFDLSVSTSSAGLWPSSWWCSDWCCFWSEMGRSAVSPGSRGNLGRAPERPIIPQRADLIGFISEHSLRLKSQS